jgi:antitoxin (DNA-binding transcriptional repressor) of toxin-antitoxin stability system
MTTTADFAKLAGALPEVVSQVLAGKEVVLTEADKPIARIVPILNGGSRPLPLLKIQSFSRPQVLTPNLTGSEIAEDMFDGE